VRLKPLIFMSLFFLLLPLAYAQCVVPYEDMVINASTTFCAGTYYLNDTNQNGAVIINGSDLVLDCNGSVLVGNLSDGSTGISILDGVSNVSIKNCSMEGYYYGMAFQGSADGVVIQDNVVNVSWNAFGNLGSGDVKNLVVSGNSFITQSYGSEFYQQVAVYMARVKNVTFSDNFVNASYTGMSINDNSYNVTVSNNEMHGYERKPLIYIMYPGTDVVTIENNSLYNHAENYFIGIYPDACGYTYIIRNNSGNGKPIYYYSHVSGLNVSNLDTNYLLLYDVNSSTFSNIKAPMQGSCLIENEFDDFEVVNGLGMVIYGGIDNVIRRLYCNHCDDVSTFLGNLYVYDSVIENTDPNFEGILPSAGGNITLVNTTFDKYAFLDTISHIIVKWYLDFKVNVPALVEIKDAFDSVVYSKETSGDRVILTQYDKWCSGMDGACTEESNVTYTPHTVTASRTGYRTYSASVLMDSNKALDIVLGSAIPTGRFAQLPVGSVLSFLAVSTVIVIYGAFLRRELAIRGGYGLDAVVRVALGLLAIVIVTYLLFQAVLVAFG